MEIIPTLNEKTDDPAIHVGNACLGISVILRKILQHIPNPKLVKLSLVNKQWNFEARNVLRDRGTLTARIWSGDHSTCEYLEMFATDLSQMRVVPFTGMSVVVGHIDGTCRSISKESLDPSYNVILERLPLKNLSVEFRIDWDECTDCAAVSVVKKILKDFGGALEELSLDSDLEDVELLQHVTLNCTFPRLKILEIESEVDDDNNEDFTNFIKTMVASAPNLLELHLGYLDFDENVLQGSSAVLVPSRFHFNPFYDIVGESVVAVLRPERIELQLQQRRRRFEPELLHRITLKVLEASRTALKTLRTDLLFVPAVMCCKFSLENVTTLEIYSGADIFLFANHLLPVLRACDFSRVFPKLNKVEFDNDPKCSFSTGRIGEFVEQENAPLETTWLNRATHVQHLVLRNSVLDLILPCLPQVFPAVKTLSMFLLTDASSIPFTLVWERFKCVRELEVECTGDPDAVANLDSVICGIHPDEIAELRKEDDEYLKAVHIVPVMPSITCMRDLRKFTFRCTTEADKLKRSDPNLIFSKVTGLICFARCPYLTATFETALRNPCAEE